MMLSLDHQQRLNLITLLDLIECPTRREAWAVCKLQDTLDLDEEERAAIELRKRPENGSYVVEWNGQKSLPAREYALGEEDIRRISLALDRMPQFVLGRDRWFRTLQAQLPEPEESNGAGVH